MQKRLIKAVVFDLDGTLTTTHVDFSVIRKQYGIPLGTSITHHCESLSDQAQVLKIMSDVEQLEASWRAQTTLQPTALELCQHLHARGCSLGLLTRNNDEAVRHFLEDCSFSPQLPLFALSLSRDFGAVKPSPEPLYHILRHVDCEPSRALMVGDYIDDIRCGAAAGAHTALLRNAHNEAFVSEADVALARLIDLLDHFEFGDKP